MSRRSLFATFDSCKTCEHCFIGRDFALCKIRFNEKDLLLEVKLHDICKLFDKALRRGFNERGRPVVI